MRSGGRIHSASPSACAAVVGNADLVAAILAPFTMYLSLAVAALLDALLYSLAGEEVVCYACKAEHRGFRREPHHPRFDRTIEERTQFGDHAVMGSEPRDGGTAGAPDPEH